MRSGDVHGEKKQLHVQSEDRSTDMSSFNTAGPNGVSNIGASSTTARGDNAAIKLYDYLRLHIIGK